MASSGNQDVILLSIVPRYAQAIMNGSKTVEFRKNGVHRFVRHVVVYASSPVQQVIGYFDVERMDIASPSSLWQRHGRLGAVTRSAFRTYFKGVSAGIAIEIRCAYRLRTPMRLTVLEVHPPQSFCYLPSRTWSNIKHRKADAVRSTAIPDGTSVYPQLG